MTRQQKRLLNFISEYILTKGWAPSYDEMKDALGLKSKSNIAALLNALEEQGRIRRETDRARAIEIVRGLSIPVDLQTYQNASKRAYEAGLSLSQYAAICINSHEARQ
jgi:SOS-response transcriptional repressor LexA